MSRRRPPPGPKPSPRVEPDPGAPLALAIDTSSAVEALCVTQGELVVATTALRRPRGRGATLVSSIQALLASLERKPSDLRALAVVIGPGAFTGLRVGIASAHGLSSALGIPAFGYPSTLGWAWAAPRCALALAVTLDARREELYTALYDWPADAVGPRELRAPTLETPAAWAVALSELAPGGALLLGDGARLHEAALREALPRSLVAGIEPAVPVLGALASDAARRAVAGEFAGPTALRPLYLRSHSEKAAIAAASGSVSGST